MHNEYLNGLSTRLNDVDFLLFFSVPNVFVAALPMIDAVIALDFNNFAYY